MAYLISNETYEKLRACVEGETGVDLSKAAEEAVADAKRVIDGLCYTREDWLDAIEEAGPDEMTEAELTWLWEQLDETGFESSFVADEVKEWMETQVRNLAEQIEERRASASA